MKKHQGSSGDVAEERCQTVEQDQAAARREAQISPIARQEIETILQATVRQYEAIRQQRGGPSFRVEERQAMMQQLKRHVYGESE